MLCEIRPMRLEDLPAVMNIERQVFSLPWPPEAFNASILKDSWVICQGEELLGYIMYHNVLDESMIINFAIAPGHQRRGHGKHLLERTLDIMQQQDLKTFYLDVRASNVTAQRLYRLHGFEVLGRRKNYYSQPDEDAIVMVRHAKPVTP